MAKLEAWVFIWAVTLFDCGYALLYRDSFACWELNPLACWLGPELAVVYRLVSLGAAFLLIRAASKKTQTVATAFLGACHLALAGWYILTLL